MSEGRPREERAEFIITSASSRYVARKIAWGDWKPGIGCRPKEREKDEESERVESREVKGEGERERDLDRNAPRESAVFTKS